jgi:hypothetical protein
MRNRMRMLMSARRALLADQHGEDAALQVAQRADELLEEGDLDPRRHLAPDPGVERGADARPARGRAPSTEQLSGPKSNFGRQLTFHLQKCPEYITDLVRFRPVICWGIGLCVFLLEVPSLSLHVAAPEGSDDHAKSTKEPAERRFHSATRGRKFEDSPRARQPEPRFRGRSPDRHGHGSSLL